MWILFFALSISSEKEVIDLIDYRTEDGIGSNVLFHSIHYADRKCETFCKGAAKEAHEFVDEKIKGSTFFPNECIEDCFNKYLFPNVKGMKQKAQVFFGSYGKVPLGGI